MTKVDGVQVGGVQVGGMPAGVAEAELGDSSIHVTLDESLYPLDAIYGAAFTFIDRSFVLLDRPAPKSVRVSLATKKPGADETVLRALLGEFVNELLSCTWRARITAENRATIEAVTMQAIGGAMGAPSLDDLEDFDFSEEPFEDPLGIAMSWEAKYGKKDETNATPHAPKTPKSEPKEDE